jgi:TonB family protein
VGLALALLVAASLVRADDTLLPGLHCERAAPLSSPLFPEGPQRRGFYGVVTLAFALDAHGKVEHVQVLHSDLSDFSDAALKYLAALQCAAPGAGAGVRHVWEFQYLLTPCDKLPQSRHSHRAVYFCGTLPAGTRATRVHGS